MGQSPSQPTPNVSHPKKQLQTDLYQLNDKELKDLLEEKSITMDEIRLVARSLKDKPRHLGFYSQEADCPDTQLAMTLNRLSPELANLRFKMVPGRLKEPMFWEATFTILKERLVESNARHEFEAEDENGDFQQPVNTMTSFPDDEVDMLDDINLNSEESDQDRSLLLEQLAVRNSQVLELRRQVKQLKHQLHHAHSSKKLHHHKGKWIMDQDSIDFLGYPEELKQNMRSEKQKRLLQVKHDMKFILDTDDIEDSNGHWNCCQATKYDHPCSKP